MSYSQPDAGENPVHYAHPEDSLAIAEHLLPTDLAARIQRASLRCKTPGQLLARAWLYNEYALATPDFASDDELFRLGRADLSCIAAMGLPPRHATGLGASMLSAYESTFRYRAHNPNSFLVPDAARVNLQQGLGGLIIPYLEGAEPTDDEYGQLSELVALTYLLDGELFPHLASWREEKNMVRVDNHDIYTLHPCAKNRIKKVPTSVKFREKPKYPDMVVTLTIGRIAVEVAKNVSPYRKDANLQAGRKEAWATRLAAEIMVRHTRSEKLENEEKTFLWLMRTRLQAPILAFADLPTTPDYASNAEALQKEIAAREAQRRIKNIEG